MTGLYTSDQMIAEELLSQLSISQSLSNDAQVPATLIMHPDYRVSVLIKMFLFVSACMHHANAEEDLVKIQPVQQHHVLRNMEGIRDSGTLHYADWLKEFVRQADFEELFTVQLSAFKDFDLCAEVQCFLKAKENLVLSNLFELKKCMTRLEPIATLKARITELNKFIDAIRAEMKSPANQAAVKARLRKSQANFKSCQKLIHGLFNKFSKINVLRLDFALKSDAKLLSGSKFTDLNHEFHAVHNLEYLKSKIAQFLQNKRHNHLLDQVVGYILKFEHGTQKGFHVHALFFLDGNKHQKDGYFAIELSKYWRKLTENQGCTYNCNLDKGKYAEVAIGMIDYTDTKKRALLTEKCVRYLCKCDQFFIFKPLAQFRTMQLSRPPKARSALGRPRKHTA